MGREGCQQPGEPQSPVAPALAQPHARQGQPLGAGISAASRSRPRPNSSQSCPSPPLPWSPPAAAVPQINTDVPQLPALSVAAPWGKRQSTPGLEGSGVFCGTAWGWSGRSCPLSHSQQLAWPPRSPSPALCPSSCPRLSRSSEFGLPQQKEVWGHGGKKAGARRSTLRLGQRPGLSRTWEWRVSVWTRWCRGHKSWAGAGQTGVQ